MANILLGGASDDKDGYYGIERRKRGFILLFTLLAIIVAVWSLSVGFYKVSLSECMRIVSDHLSGDIVDVTADNIVFGSRLPIAVFAIVCGACLSMGGAVMQSILRNPLADPYMMGISSGASFGVALSVIAEVGVGLSGQMAQTAMAFLFSLIPMAVVLLFSLKRRITATKIILIGIAVSYIFSACTTLLMMTANEESLSEVYSWNVGSLALITWDSLPIPLAVTIVGAIVLYSMQKRIDVMMSGPNTAHSLGVNVERTTLVLMVTVSLMTAAVVSFCGTIGFIGLVGPHIARVFVGSSTRYLLPASAAFGGAYLLIANVIASVTGPSGLPVGVVSALVGCPLFIFILLKVRKNAW